MEHLIMLVFLGGLAYAGYKSLIGGDDSSSGAGRDKAPATAAAEPDSGLEFERFVTITADDPDGLAREIDGSLYWERRDRNRVIGTPQISADGRTAQVPIYRRT